MKVRYIRESMTGSNTNSGCHWCEIQAINYEGINVALSKTVTSQGGSYEKGTLDMITNGNTTVDDYIYFRNDAGGTISVTVDLENVEDIDNIKVWHYHGGGRTYQNILLETSLDGVKWVEVFDSNKNGEYVEVDEGKTHKLIDDRLPLLTENSSLNEVTSFYEKYIEQDISNKEFLKNVLTSKEVECTGDKMINLINKVRNIEIGRKWASGEGNSYNTTGSKAFFEVSNLNFKPSVILVFPTENYQIFHAYWDNNTIYSKSVYVSAGTGIILSSASTTITNNGFNVQVYSSSQSPRKMEWIAFE